MKPLRVQKPLRSPNPEFVFYRRGEEAYLRAKAVDPQNPRTPAQVQVRSAFRLMQRVLDPLRSLFPWGFAPGEKENGRRVSSYHMALGENIREAIVMDGQGVPRVDYSRLKISRGMASLSGMRVERRGCSLVITHTPLRDARYARLLVAVYSAEREQWCLFNEGVDFSLGQHVVQLPEGWEGHGLHVYVGAGSEKSGRRYHCESRHFEVPPLAKVTPPPLLTPPAPLAADGATPLLPYAVCRVWVGDGVGMVYRAGGYYPLE